MRGLRLLPRPWLSHGSIPPPVGLVAGGRCSKVASSAPVQGSPLALVRPLATWWRQWCSRLQVGGGSNDDLLSVALPRLYSTAAISEIKPCARKASHVPLPRA